MGNVIHRTTKEYRVSVNTPDFAPAVWIVNPTGPAALIASGIPVKYWKINVDDTVSEMSAPEKVTVDSTPVPDTLGVERYHVSTRKAVKLDKEEWFAIDNGNGTYSGKTREIAYTYAGTKLTKTVNKQFRTDGSVASTETIDYYTNPVTGATIEKRS